MRRFYWIPRFWLERCPTPLRNPGERVIDGIGVSWLWWEERFYFPLPAPPEVKQ